MWGWNKLKNYFLKLRIYHLFGQLEYIGIRGRDKWIKLRWSLKTVMVLKS